MSKYLVEGYDKYMTVEDILEILDVHENFDSCLDETQEIVNICGLEFYPSTILKELDPIAYECAYDEYKQFIEEELCYELLRMEADEEIEFYGLYISRS